MDFLANTYNFFIEPYIIASCEFALDIVFLIHWELKEEFRTFLLEKDYLFQATNSPS